LPGASADTRTFEFAGCRHVHTATIEKTMEEFVHREKLKIFRRQLALAKDDARRQLLLRLLAEEEAKVPVRTK